MIDIRHLRYFMVIADQRSFTRAAQALNVAQPALSLHVRHMEADLGVPLLVRTCVLRLLRYWWVRWLMPPAALPR